MFVTLRAVTVWAASSILVVVSPAEPLITLLLVNLALAALVATDVLRAPSAASLRFGREAPEVMKMGESKAITLTLRNSSSKDLKATVRDLTASSLDRTPEIHTVVVPPRGRARLISQVQPRKRGLIEVGPLIVRTQGPLRLAGRQQRLDLRHEVKVYPALPGRAEVALRLDRARLLQSGERSTAIRGGGGEFDSLREYHPDDEFRRINWKATARSPKPISNTYREEHNQQVLLLVDSGRMMAGTLRGATYLEHAIDAAVAVAELATRVGDHVGMAAFGKQVYSIIGPRSGANQPKRIIETLYDLQPALESSSYARVFASILTRYRRRALLILLTQWADESAMETLLTSMPALLTRHLVIVGAVSDPDLQTAAYAVPVNSEQAYLKAAASQATLSRARTAATLRRLGADVVDRPPGQFAGALADRYLSIKAHGRL